MFQALLQMLSIILLKPNNKPYCYILSTFQRLKPKCAEWSLLAHFLSFGDLNLKQLNILNTVKQAPLLKIQTEQFSC